MNDVSYTKKRSTRTVTRHRGFTLIEIMVSISIFVIIVTIGMGSLLSVMDAYRNIREKEVNIDNLNFVLENMSRTIRAGRSYSCATSSAVDCGLGGAAFYFNDQDGKRVIYSRKVTSSGGVMQRSIDGVTEDLTTTDAIDIKELQFFLTGSEPGGSSDYDQPFVSIMIEGETLVKDKKRTVILQTSITQRFLDI